MQPITLERPAFTIQGALEGVRISIALLIAIFSAGMVFGILARHAGMNLSECTIMSAFVFAGAAQFASLDLWITPLPVLTILIATFAINLRFMLMGAAIRPYYSNLKLHQTYTSVFFMGDESWALAIREFSAGGRNAALMIGSGLAQWFAWVSSTAFGYALSSSIQNPSQWGLDFVFTAAFAAILAGMFKSKSDLLPWGIAATVALTLSHFLPGKWYILGGGIAGTLVGYLRDSDEI
ncbi:MAG TPA: AzlC family ABC transporter permease [Acidobacteriota bacterium]|nr:AzlC family ABC transporter permease [Acidobacteriota bacterium]